MLSVTGISTSEPSTVTPDSAVVTVSSLMLPSGSSSLSRTFTRTAEPSVGSSS